MLEFKEATKQADVPSGYTALIEYAKIVVPLASGLLAFTIVFMKELLPEPSGWMRWVLFISWLGATIAVVSGLFALGHLSRRLRRIPTPMWWINEACLVSLFSYGIAIVALASLAAAALFRHPTLQNCYQHALHHAAKQANVDERSLWLRWCAESDAEAPDSYAYTWEKQPEMTRYTVVIKRSDGHLIRYTREPDIPKPYLFKTAWIWRVWRGAHGGQAGIALQLGSTPRSFS